MADDDKPENLYYVLSLKWTKNDHLITWWAPDNNGYVWDLANAGKYAESQIREHSNYYNNGIDTLAVPCDVVDQAAARVVLNLASARSTFSECRYTAAVEVTDDETD